MLLFLHAIRSSNILETYMIFCINKEMKRSTEKAKTMIGDQAYIMVLLGLLGDVHKGNFTWNLKALMSSRVC